MVAMGSLAYDQQIQLCQQLLDDPEPSVRTGAVRG